MNRFLQKNFRQFIHCVLLLIVWAAGCDLLDEVSPDPKKPEDVLVNPVDPKSPVFEKPVTTIVYGPSENQVLSVSDIQVTIEGNKDAVKFSHRIDLRAWDAWNSNKVITCTDLDEGKHTFEVRALHRDGVTVEEKPPVRHFSVNAVHGPAVMFSSRKKEVRWGEQFNYYIVAEEVQGLYGVKIVFSYDPTIIAINSIASGSTGGASVQLFESQYSNKARMEMFFTGTAPLQGISGTDSIAVVNCTARSSGVSFFTFIADSIRFRDVNNATISVRQIVNGKVVVK